MTNPDPCRICTSPVRVETRWKNRILGAKRVEVRRCTNPQCSSGRRTDRKAPQV